MEDEFVTYFIILINNKLLFQNGRNNSYYDDTSSYNNPVTTRMGNGQSGANSSEWTVRNPYYQQDEARMRRY